MLSCQFICESLEASVLSQTFAANNENMSDSFIGNGIAMLFHYSLLFTGGVSDIRHTLLVQYAADLKAIAKVHYQDPVFSGNIVFISSSVGSLDIIFEVYGISVISPFYHG